jgi:hypothetical protein
MRAARHGHCLRRRRGTGWTDTMTSWWRSTLALPDASGHRGGLTQLRTGRQSFSLSDAGRLPGQDWLKPVAVRVAPWVKTSSCSTFVKKIGSGRLINSSRSAISVGESASKVIGMKPSALPLNLLA